MPRELFLEQRKIIRAGCYKEQKYAVDPKDPIDVQAKKRAMQACDFGFTQIEPLCKSCVFFQITEVVVNGRPAITDRIIQRADVPSLALDYRDNDTADPAAAQKIAQEKAAANRAIEVK